MRKLIWLLLVCAVVVSLAAGSIAMAAGPDKGHRGLKGQAGNSTVAFIEL